MSTFLEQSSDFMLAPFSSWNSFPMSQLRRSSLLNSVVGGSGPVRIRVGSRSDPYFVRKMVIRKLRKVIYTFLQADMFFVSLKRALTLFPEQESFAHFGFESELAKSI